MGGGTFQRHFHLILLSAVASSRLRACIVCTFESSRDRPTRENFIERTHTLADESISDDYGDELRLRKEFR